jgi:hypothetical protein
MAAVRVGFVPALFMAFQLTGVARNIWSDSDIPQVINGGINGVDGG